jgi:hypothetical protein
MLPSTTYQMRQVVVDGSNVSVGATLSFTTGQISQSLPAVTIGMNPNGQTSLTDRVVLHGMLNTQDLTVNVPFATDLSGNVIWYYNAFSSVSGLFYYLTRPVAGGTFLILGSIGRADDILAEVDLAGNTLRQTDRLRINAQLTAIGLENIIAIHHDAVRLPNGQTLIIGMLQHSTSGGGAILGDMIIALDSNFQVIWTWNAFDHLSTARGPVLGETCFDNYLTFCPSPTLSAVDWLHSNSLAYTQDHNLLLSMRDQDWVIKIDYQDGSGPGDIIWTLGAGGDFSLQSTDAWPWFSHQHDVEWLGSNQITLFDNGNTRCVFESPCNSRGQVLQLDETNHVARLIFNQDLGVYASSLGSAQILSNGDYGFGAGYIVPGVTSAMPEYVPNGTLDYNIQVNASEYRMFRMPSLYVPPSGQ